MMNCSVCIATYKRPALLEKLLNSLASQVLPAGVNIEIVVVDNDPEGSAETTVDKFTDTSRLSFRYFRQTIKNISLTRNVAVKNATGDYLFFVDDDETVCSEWIAKLLQTLHEYNADGVFGPTFPTYDPTAPQWIRKGERLFIDTVPKAATGAEAIATWCGNCLIKAALVKNIEGPFDPEYGTTGGEDTELFNRLKRYGARFVYCNEAPAFEYWPPTRTSVAYLMHRSLKGTNAHTRRAISLSKRKTLVRAYMLLKALGLGFTSLVLVLLSFPHKVWRTYWEMKLASNAGRLLAVFGHYGQAYK